MDRRRKQGHCSYCEKYMYNRWSTSPGWGSRAVQDPNLNCMACRQRHDTGVSAYQAHAERLAVELGELEEQSHIHEAVITGLARSKFKLRYQEQTIEYESRLSKLRLDVEANSKLQLHEQAIEFESKLSKLKLDVEAKSLQLQEQTKEHEKNLLKLKLDVEAKSSLELGEQKTEFENNLSKLILDVEAKTKVKLEEQRKEYENIVSKLKLDVEAKSKVVNLLKKRIGSLEFETRFLKAGSRRRQTELEAKSKLKLEEQRKEYENIISKFKLQADAKSKREVKHKNAMSKVKLYIAELNNLTGGYTSEHSNPVKLEAESDESSCSC